MFARQIRWCPLKQKCIQEKLRKSEIAKMQANSSTAHKLKQASNNATKLRNGKEGTVKEVNLTGNQLSGQKIAWKT